MTQTTYPIPDNPLPVFVHVDTLPESGDPSKVYIVNSTDRAYVKVQSGEFVELALLPLLGDKHAELDAREAALERCEVGLRRREFALKQYHAECLQIAAAVNKQEQPVKWKTPWKDFFLSFAVLYSGILTIYLWKHWGMLP